MADTKDAPKPDFRKGFSLQHLADGGIAAGTVDGEDVILVRRGDSVTGSPPRRPGDPV